MPASQSPSPPLLRLQALLTRRFILLMSVLTLLLLASNLLLLLQQQRIASRQVMQAELGKAELLIAAEHQRLVALARDYASWDETYRFIQSQDPKFVRTNFGESYQGMGIDFTALLDLNGKLLYVIGGNGQHPPPLALSAALAQLRLAVPVGKVDTRVRQFGTHPTLLALAPVTTTDESAPANGIIVMGRYLDGEYAAKLSEQIKAQVVVAHSLPPLQAPSLLGTGSYRAYSPLAQGGGLLLAVDKHLDDPRLLSSLLLFCLNVLLLMLVAGWWMRSFLRDLVIRRIERFAQLAQRRAQGEAVIWPVDGYDELDQLARSYNGLMEEVAEVQESLRQQALSDELTGLGNRRALDLALLQQLQQAAPKLSLLLLDLDGFKQINDSLGHATGDYLLQQVARLLGDGVRANDRLFRIGSDEFAALLPATEAHEAEALACRLLVRISEQLPPGRRRVRLTASAGVAVLRPDLGGASLLRDADLAMCAAKRQGQSSVCIYQSEMGEGFRERVAQEQALRDALAADAFEPWFQPVVDADSGRVLSLELLARWNRDGVMVPPLAFIALAEEMGLIGALSDRLLEKALTWFTAEHVRQPHLHLQVNLSPLQFAEHNLADKLLYQLAACGLPASALVVEITESAALDYSPQVDGTLQRLQHAGIGLHLDDFGTGYSSMARLKDLPFDTVKLDRSFVMAINDGDESLAQMVFDMAQSMGMALIAEGVENQLEYEVLYRIGYRQMQGFYFAKPMPCGQLQDWMAHSNA